MAQALDTAITQQLLGFARADMARARKANDREHMIAGGKGGMIYYVRYLERNSYEIARGGSVTVNGYAPGKVLHTGDGATTAAFLVDEVYDITIAD